jgi:hypothetical protein
VTTTSAPRATSCGSLAQGDRRTELHRLGNEQRARLITLRATDAHVELHQSCRLDDRVSTLLPSPSQAHWLPGQRKAMLDHGQQIGHDLARVRQVGQAVDHRDGGVSRQFLDLGMIVGADHDRVAHAAEHARGIGHRLAAAELHPCRHPGSARCRPAAASPYRTTRGCGSSSSRRSSPARDPPAAHRHPPCLWASPHAPPCGRSRR